MNRSTDSDPHGAATPTPGISRRNALALAAASALGAAGVPVRGRASPTPPPQSRADARDFGAACDGVTNDAPAIQAALDASDCVELPRGIYCIKEPIRINTGQILLGCGSTLQGTGGHDEICRGTDPRFGDQLIEFPVIRDLRLEGFSVGLQAEGMSWGDFQNLLVSRCETGYRLATGDHGTCYYNTFTSCHVGADVGVGVFFEGMRNERFKDPETDEALVKGANGNLFQGCKIGGESICLEIHAPVKNLVFTACSIERGRPGITLLNLGTVSDAQDCDQCDAPICEKCKLTGVEFLGCNFEGGGEVDGVFQKGLLRVGRYAQDCSFFGPTIPGGVDVEDLGHLTNWLPTGAGRGGIHKFYALDPGNASARIGAIWDSKLFASVNTRIVWMDLDGRVEWRVPGTKPQEVPADVSLHRAGAGLLGTEQDFIARGSSPGPSPLTTKRSGRRYASTVARTA